MELGATICRPSNPNCDACPVNSVCGAHKRVQNFLAQGGCLSSPDAPKVTDYPVAVKKSEKKQQVVAICVLKIVPVGASASKCNSNKLGAYLMVKRPPKGLLAGLWEFPTVPDVSGLDSEDRKTAMLKMLADRYRISLSGQSNFKLLIRKDVGEENHIFSHVRMTMHVENMVLAGDLQESSVPDGVDVKWVPAEEMSQQGLSTMVKKAWVLCSKNRSQSSLDRFYNKEGN